MTVPPMRTTTVSTSHRSSSEDPALPLTYRDAVLGLTVVVSTRADGDMHPEHVPLEVLNERRQRVMPGKWTQLDQRHGIDVVVVTDAGDRDGEVGDVAVTECRDAVLAVWTGDCAPIVAVDATGSRLVAAHAGWRGVAGGVIDAAVDALANDVATVVIGPTIGPCCYEFSEEDLAAVADGARVDAAVIAGQTRSGSPALDMRAAVSAALLGRGIASSSIVHLGGCTGCDIEMYSHRVRRDTERFATAARLDAMVPG